MDAQNKLVNLLRERCPPFFGMVLAASWPRVYFDLEVNRADFLAMYICGGRLVLVVATEPFKALDPCIRLRNRETAPSALTILFKQNPGARIELSESWSAVAPLGPERLGAGH